MNGEPKSRKLKVNPVALAAPVDVDDPRLIHAEVVALLGISKAMVSKLKTAGHLTFDVDGTAPRSRVLAEYEKYQANRRPRVDRDGAAASRKSPEYYAARSKREVTAARREALILAREEGKVVEVAAVARRWFEAGRRARDLVLGVAERVPAEVIAAVRAEPDDAKAIRTVASILDNAIRAALISLDKQP